MSVLKLELTEEQAEIVSKACEFFARIRMGQYMEIVHNCLDVKQEHYSEKREALSRVLLHAREYTHPDLERTFGHSYGMGKYEDADRAFDVHQVIRHALGDDREPFSYYDLPKCEAVPDKMTNGDRIRAMTDEELIPFIDGKIDFCKRSMECSLMLEADKEIPEEWCVQCASEWLRKPAEEVQR